MPDDDLLTRLRDWPCDRIDCGSTVCNLLREAAAEVARLRADLEAAVNALADHGITFAAQMMTCAKVAVLEAENVRLKDTVRSLADRAAGQSELLSRRAGKAGPLPADPARADTGERA